VNSTGCAEGEAEGDDDDPGDAEGVDPLPDFPLQA